MLLVARRMHPLSRAVLAHLSTASPERAGVLRAWFGAFPTELQDVMLERAKRQPGNHAVVFRESTHDLGLIAG